MSLNECVDEYFTKEDLDRQKGMEFISRYSSVLAYHKDDTIVLYRPLRFNKKLFKHLSTFKEVYNGKKT